MINYFRTSLYICICVYLYIPPRRLYVDCGSSLLLPSCPRSNTIVRNVINQRMRNQNKDICASFPQTLWFPYQNVLIWVKKNSIYIFSYFGVGVRVRWWQPLYHRLAGRWGAPPTMVRSSYENYPSKGPQTGLRGTSIFSRILIKNHEKSIFWDLGIICIFLIRKKY